MFMVYYPCAVGIHYIYIYQVITDVMEKAKNGYFIKHRKKCKAIKILSFYLMQLLFYATFALFNHH